MITIDSTSALLTLGSMLVRILRPEPALSIIGQRAAEGIRRRIQRTKDDPDGNAWAPWRPMTRTRREAKGNAGQGLLWDDGTLLDSIRAQSSDSGVEIGSDVAYAPYLQSGTSRMEARPFIGWDDDSLRQAETTMLHFIAVAL